MRRLRLEGETWDEDADGFQQRLALAHRSRVRPLCLCRQGGVPMYIADVGNQHVVKRMPLSGRNHDPRCHSYEPPYELSGLGPLVGRAIKLDPTDGTASLSLDFSLSWRGARGVDGQPSVAAANGKAARGKLSMRALLHLLWHESGLTEWTGHWTGRRQWWQVYHHLVEATRHLQVRGESLSDRLFAPEPFRATEKTAIEQRRAQKLSGLFRLAVGPRKLMIVVAEIKEFGAARDGQHIVVRHMPGFRLHLSEAAWRSLRRRFETELSLWQRSNTSHLMMIATVDGDLAGLVRINEMALMTVSEQWLPVETAYEEILVARLARLHNKIVKCLRFNLSGSQPLASAIMLETRPLPCALYIVPPTSDAGFEAELKDVIRARPDLSAWIWRVADGDMPPLPF